MERKASFWVGKLEKRLLSTEYEHKGNTDGEDTVLI